MLQFDLPKDQSSIIKVIGVGGGGSNAVNHMFSQNIEGVNFIICNTDAQAIALSNVPNKIQLGPHLTQGLGAGANPAIGRQACEESLDEIKRILEVNTKMAFITAGMGGGTGTGGAPILAKICKDLGILTVGIVTTPFAYEGKKRLAQAEEGISLLKDHVDTLLVISNDKLRHQFGNLKMKEAFAKADNVLATAAKCITDVINSTGQINVDFADVCTVMSNGGVAILGSACAEGENRAQLAIENALNSPLLNDNDIRGAKWILININSCEGDHEFTMDEVEVIQNYLLSHAGEDTDVILGLGYDNTLGAQIGITLIATGFEHKDPFAKAKPAAEEKKDDRIIMTLDIPVKEVIKVVQPTLLFEKEEESAIAEITEKPAFKPEAENIMPKPAEDAVRVSTPLVTMNKVEKKDESAPVFYEISSSADQIPVIEFDLEQPQKPQEKTIVAETKTIEEIPVTNTPVNSVTENTPYVVSGGYLAKPSNIYVEEKQREEKINVVADAVESNAVPEIKEEAVETTPSPISIIFKEEEPVFEMQMVLKEVDASAVENQVQEQPPVEKTEHIMMSKPEVTPIPDETEELRIRARERVAKLRNLSFNINAADPNNEYETIPAYLRRDVDLHNSIADVETFYSNYTVKSDDNNQAAISSINEFLDGNKPD